MIERIDERRRIFREHDRAIYALREGGAAVTYEALTDTASVNMHATTNVTGNMSQYAGTTCEFLDGEACWFDGTSCAAIQPDDEAIWALLERWLGDLR